MRMIDDSPFFKTLWRFNAIAIAGIVGVALIAGAFAVGVGFIELLTYRSVSSQTVLAEAGENPAPGASGPGVERPGAFHPLGRTGALYATIERVDRIDGEARAFGASYGKKSHSVIDWLSSIGRTTPPRLPPS